MRVHSLLKWFFLALLIPLDSTAAAPQHNAATFGYVEPDVSGVLPRLEFRPDVFRFNRTPPITAVRRPIPSVQTPALRFFGNSGFQLVDINFGGEHSPVSANTLRAPGKAQRELEKALQAAKKGEWQKAQQHLHKSLEAYPAFSAAYHNLGVIALILGQQAEAVPYFERALELDDRNPYPLFVLTQLHIANNETATAQRYVERFLAGSPLNPYALALQGAVQARQGQMDAALRTFTRLERKDHGSICGFHLLAGSLYEAKQDIPKAIAEYKQYLKESPGAPDQAEVRAAIAKLQLSSVGKTAD